MSNTIDKIVKFVAAASLLGSFEVNLSAQANNPRMPSAVSQKYDSQNVSPGELKYVQLCTKDDRALYVINKLHRGGFADITKWYYTQNGRFLGEERFSLIEENRKPLVNTADYSCKTLLEEKNSGVA